LKCYLSWDEFLSTCTAYSQRPLVCPLCAVLVAGARLTRFAALVARVRLASRYSKLPSAKSSVCSASCRGSTQGWCPPPPLPPTPHTRSTWLPELSKSRHLARPDSARDLCVHRPKVVEAAFSAARLVAEFKRVVWGTQPRASSRRVRVRERDGRHRGRGGSAYALVVDNAPALGSARAFFAAALCCDCLLSDPGRLLVAPRHQAGQLLPRFSVDNLNTSGWDRVERFWFWGQGGWRRRWRRRRKRRWRRGKQVSKKLHQSLQLCDLSLHGCGRVVVLGARDERLCRLGLGQVIGRWR